MLKFDLSILWTFVNIIVLFLFLKKFLFKPVNQILERRQEAIRRSLQDAENKKQEAFALKDSYDADIKAAGDQATLIMKEARERAELEYNRILQDAKTEAARMVAEAQKTIELERDKALEAAQSEIAALAMLATSRLLDRNVDDSSNRKYLGDFLKEVGAAK